ncbi:hypothetical protein FE257_004447 [Aspergillus nanangensis]|uniref:Uncharacterized protein n=1 Tax=Aspergillus nanangensis TaxID=2582783 RepID=A0AAD4CY23_ASPNN|nr:hypothetical protein FE257_004447 [Aspergillus nanangensis]
MFGDFPLSDKIILITGGASGIGFALAKLAVESNAKVIIADLKPSPDSTSIVEAHETVRFSRCDVSKWADLASTISFSVQEFGDVPDVYAANAGVPETERNSFWDDNDEERYSLLDINLSHPIKLTRLAIRALLGKNKKGVVMITASIGGLEGHFSTALYCAAKHGVIGLIKSLAAAEDEAGVKVVGICPGPVRTPLMATVENKLSRTGEKPTFLEPEEIAGRMKELIELGRYRGGMALGVYRPGHVEVVADGSTSALEAMCPPDVMAVRRLIATERSI